MRNESDYNLNIEINWPKAEDALIKAERLLRNFQEKFSYITKRLQEEDFLIWLIKKYGFPKKNATDERLQDY